MEKIKTFDELQMLRFRIMAAREKCKERPEMEQGTFVQKLLDNVPPKERECNDHNEQNYSSLPQEIEVTSEIGQVLLNLFLAQLKTEYAVKNKLPTTTDAISNSVGMLLAALFPSPISIAKALYSGHSVNKKFDSYSEGMDELLRVADKNMQGVMGSYQLTKNDDGNFVLKRGEWFVGHYSKSNSFRGHDYKVWYTAIKNVGIDPNLIPNEQKYLLDTKNPRDPRESPTVGLWEDEQKQRHLFKG